MKFGSRLSQSDIRQAQDDLRTLGFYKGESTGVIDQATVGAVVEFQRAHGAFVDGALGLQTKALIRESVAALKAKR